MAASPPPASMEAVFPGPSGKVGRTAHAGQASPWSRRVETCVLSYGFPAPPSRGEGAGLRCPQPGLALLTRVSLSSLQRACEFGPLFRLCFHRLLCLRSSISSCLQGGLAFPESQAQTTDDSYLTLLGFL